MFNITASESEPVSIGSVIKERFILEANIGRGGMGTVFLARDLRKAEALDPNPCVALRVLHEEIKPHPDGLQALQREVRKAQDIAHPNIAGIYDFDRDSGPFFVVMELLEGESLDIASKRTAGMPMSLDEVLRITGDICNAMAYAHARGVVHADFKIANVFLTKQGVVKVLDFGISRPLIEGRALDVRDDVHAIACVVYELLTGVHPYQRRSMQEARDARLQAVRPANLPRRQWRALRSALKFDRDDRPASALLLLEGLLPKRRAPIIYFGVAAAAVAVAVIIGALASMQAMAYRDRSVTHALVSDNASQIESALPSLRALTPERRARIFLDSAARAGLLDYYMKRVDAEVDPQQGRYNYARADALIKDLWGLLADSQAVKKLVDRVSARRSYALQRQTWAAIDARDLEPVTRSNDWERWISVPPAVPSPATDKPRRRRPMPAIKAPLSAERYASPPAVTTPGNPEAHATTPDSALASSAAQSRAAAAANVVSQDVPNASSVNPPVGKPDIASTSTASSAPKTTDTVPDAEEADARAQIATLKSTLLNLARSNRAQEATVTLGALRAQLPAADPFVAKEAPQAIGLAYMRLASKAAADGRIEDAANLIDSGVQVDPASRGLAAARSRYARYAEISDQLQSEDRIPTHHLRYRIWRVSKLAPAEMSAINKRWARDLALRIVATKDRTLATRLAEVGRALFPSDPAFQAASFSQAKAP